MKTKLSRWGNSLAVRIPAQIVSDAALEEGREMSIEISDGALQLKPVKRTPSLDELIDQITEENLHAEVDFGAPLGGEAG